MVSNSFLKDGRGIRGGGRTDRQTDRQGDRRRGRRPHDTQQRHKDDITGDIECDIEWDAVVHVRDVRVFRVQKEDYRAQNLTQGVIYTLWKVSYYGTS